MNKNYKFFNFLALCTALYANEHEMHPILCVVSTNQSKQCNECIRAT